MRVENQRVEAVVLGDVGGDLDGTLVAELAAELEVVEGEGVVGRLGPRGGVSACSLPPYISVMERYKQTDHAGRTSRSEAMFAKLLVTSL